MIIFLRREAHLEKTTGEPSQWEYFETLNLIFNAEKNLVEGVRVRVHSDHLRRLCERGHLWAGQVRGQQVRRLLPPITLRFGECHPAIAGGAARQQQEVSEGDLQW